MLIVVVVMVVVAVFAAVYCAAIHWRAYRRRFFSRSLRLPVPSDCCSTSEMAGLINYIQLRATRP